MDTQVGRIVAALEQRGMRDKTLIFFTTDNGGAASARFASGAGQPDIQGAPPASNNPFSGGKGTLREGGVRLPAIVNWPGKIKPAVINEPLHHVDLMPTLLALAGGTGDARKPIDGKDAWGTIAAGQPSPHDDILINVELFRGAIRKGKWKLVKFAVLPGKTELFDLEADPAEKNDVAKANPAVVHELETRLLAYAAQQKMSEWLKAQQDYFGLQAQTALDVECNEDRGAEHEQPALPQQKK
jgi:arylsulfatase A-like enzyme